MEKKRTLMAIFSHPDDELGCAGTLANHSDAGNDVYLMFLTRGENATTIPGTAEEKIKIRKKHSEEIEKILGIKVLFMDFPDSQIEYTMEGAYKIAEELKRIRPNAIITWNQTKRLGSGHPDHRNTSKLVYDAISYARYNAHGSKFDPVRIRMTLYTYTLQGNQTEFPVRYVDVGHQLERISKFIEVYKKAYGDWPVQEMKLAWMRLAGLNAGVTHAEALAVVLRGFPAEKTLPLTPDQE